MQTERELKERAKRLGYKLKRRGTEYSLVDDEGAGPSGTIEGIARWLDVIEHKLAVQFSTACGMPLFKINALPRPRVAEPTPITLEPHAPHGCGAIPDIANPTIEGGSPMAEVIDLDHALEAKRAEFKALLEQHKRSDALANAIYGLAVRRARKGYMPREIVAEMRNVADDIEAVGIEAAGIPA